MRSPECPRCGYDLSGKLDGYRESCSLEDTCSECGCGYQWRSIFGELVYPRWFVESLRPRWLLRVAPTVVRCAHPVSFWRGIRMEHPFRVRRALIALFMLYLVLASVVTIARISERSRFNWLSVPDKILWAAGNLAWPIGVVDAAEWRSSFFDIHVDRIIVPPVVVPIMAGIAAPILFIVPVFTRAAYGVRKTHILRIAIYGFTGLFLVATVSLLIDVWVLPSLFPGWYYDSDIWNPVIRGAPILLTLLWQLWWWVSATRHYLRIDEAWAFAGPLVIASILAGVVALYVLALVYQDATRYAFGMAS